MPEDDELDLLPRPRRVDMSRREKVPPSGEPCHGVDPSLPVEGYRLKIDPSGRVTISARDDPGLFYGRATLGQLARCSTDGVLPVGEIEDWPDLEVRGVMLDVSRCRVPTMSTLFGIVDRIASWKMNHLELYMEHTFAYPGHEAVWADAGAYSPDDMECLAAYCRERHISLVPNQNTLGHMERWLVHDRYAGLGISRGVVTNPFGLPVAASTLDPARPGSAELIHELVRTLAAAVPSSRFHIGLDEPWDLPAERVSEWAEWTRKLCSFPELSDREVLVWGDMLAVHPELIGKLPERVTVCEWGYDAGHPFASRGGVLGGAGVTHWLCPGTSSWLSVVGRTTNAIDNCREAALATSSTGATGLLVTEWGDFGHHQGLSVADPALAAAAAFSWCAETNCDLGAQAIGDLLDLHSFSDPTGLLGGSLVTLGDVYRSVPFQAPMLSALVLHLYLPQVLVGSDFTAGLQPADLDSIEETIRRCLGGLGNATPGTDHGRLAVAELSTGARLVQLCCRDARERLAVGGQLGSVPSDRRMDLVEELDGVVTSYRADWLARDRPGGLEESCEWLAHLRHCYATGSASAQWAGPLVERVRARDTRR